MIYGFLGDLKAAEHHYQRAISLNPNDANVLTTFGVLLAWLGRADEGITTIHEAMRLNPYHPDWYWTDLGMVFYAARRYSEAVAAFGRNASQSSHVLSRIAACYGQMNRMEEAAAAMTEVLRQQPDFSLRKLQLIEMGPEAVGHLRDGLRKAGLPD